MKRKSVVVDEAAASDYLRSQLTISTQCEDLMEGIAGFMKEREPKRKGR